MGDTGGMEAEVKPAARKPKRRWFQFSLAWLLLLTLVCGVVLGLWVAPAERQRRAAEYVEGLGGGVRYASEDEDGNRAPEWLRRSVGDDYFRSVEEIDLRDTQVSDAGLAHLENLTALERLYLSGTQVSDAGLAHLESLTALKELNLGGTQVSDAGLAHLENLTALKVLFLYGTQVSDAGLAHLERLTGLEWLNLGSTQVSDAGLAHLERLTALEGLLLSGTQVSDAGVAELRMALPNCSIPR